MRSFLLLAAVALLGCVASLAFADDRADFAQCGFRFGDNVASFNLDQLRARGSDYYSFTDADGRKFYYNICKSLTKEPEECAGKGLAVAYVVGKDKSCTPLSDLEWQTTTKYALTSNKKPHEGMTLTYVNSKNDNSDIGTATLSIRFQCANNDKLPIVAVVDTAIQHYEIVIESPDACPLECPLAQRKGLLERKVCGGAGICGYDTLQKHTRCFCNANLMGKDCSETPKSGTYRDEIVEFEGTCGSACAALAVIFVILLCVTGFMGYVAYKLWVMQPARKVDVDSANLVHFA